MKRCYFILVMITIAAAAFAQNQNTHLLEGNKLYKENKYNEAVPQYIKAVESDADTNVANFNLGNAYFRTKKYDEAEKTYDNTIMNGINDSMKQSGFYNKGVTLSKQNKLEESIEAYKMAVKLNPADSNARVNLQKALLELKKRNPPPEKKEQKKKQQNKNPHNQPPQSKLTKKQVEQLLKALQQREQQVQQKMQQRNRSTTQQDKDW
jgi:Ca-activated chloride channel family protein